MHDFTFLNSSVQTFCPSTFQNGIWCYFLIVLQTLDPRSGLSYRNPFGKVQLAMENPKYFLGWFYFGTNGSQSHGGDSGAHVHLSDVLAFKHVPFSLVSSELHLSPW